MAGELIATFEAAIRQGEIALDPQAQGADPQWNAANCRNRMIYPVRAAQKPVFQEEKRSALLSTFRRDLGGGRYAMVKVASAPIWLQGRYWG